MKKNRFAQLLYGKVVYIYETDLTKEKLSTIFSPDTYWLDVTDMECEVGYTASFKDGIGVVLVKPSNNIEDYSLEEYKAKKTEEMKLVRDSLEERPIILEDNRIYDFDERAREKINLAKAYLEAHKEESSITWILANNDIAETTLEDFNTIVDIAVKRSSENHYQYAQLRAYIKTLETKDEVDEVKWNSLEAKE